MRKSLLKTPPSALSSKPAAQPAALVVGALVRRAAPKRNGSVFTSRRSDSVAKAALSAKPHSLPELPRRSGDLAEADRLAARVRLLEGFISRTHIGDCAQHALQWLADVGRVSRSVCLVTQPGEQSLVMVGAH